MTTIRPVDVLCGAFLVALLLVVAGAAGRLPHPGRTAAVLVALLAGYAAVVALARARPAPAARFAHAFYPVAVVVVVFDALADVAGYLIGPDRDAALTALDLALFGVHPTVWLERLVTPWLTDLMHLAYVSYYALPLVVCGRLYARGAGKEFDLAAFTLTLTLFLSYVGYLLVPAQGPRALVAALQTAPLDGVLVTEPIRRTLETLERLKRDAFPSGHTAVAVVAVALARRLDRRLFPGILPFGAGVVLSTVYTRYHYVVDVIAGLALAALCLALGPALHRRLAALLARLAQSGRS